MKSVNPTGGHINPAVTFGLFVGRKVSLIRALLYMVAQCLGAICGCGLVKAFQKTYYNSYGGGANELQEGFNKGTGLGAEIIGTFVLVYTVFSATDPKRSARDSHVPVCSLLPSINVTILCMCCLIFYHFIQSYTVFTKPKLSFLHSNHLGIGLFLVQINLNYDSFYFKSFSNSC